MNQARYESARKKESLITMSGQTHSVFITGGTGYIGRQLVARLLERGHQVRVLVRPGSEKKMPPGCIAVLGDALDGATYAGQVAPSDTFVQLVGVAHPSPAKASQFRKIDLVSGLAAVAAAKAAGIRHFVYLSVAQPAPMMKAYIEVRAECEAAIRAAAFNATILRPWYVLGPGHLWPYLLLPAYKVAELLPPTRDGAQRMGLVTLEQMTLALLSAVEHPAQGIRIVSVPEIRKSASDVQGLLQSARFLKSGPATRLPGPIFARCSESPITPPDVAGRLCCQKA